MISEAVAVAAPVEVQELRKLNASLMERIRGLTEEQSGNQEMHSALRQTVDKLKVGLNIKLIYDLI